MDEPAHDQSQPDDSVAPPLAIPVIVEDLYCLECGYNLRGLSGDPVRCPECGYLNDLGTVAIPAQLITAALRNMETAPTMCVAAVFVVCSLGSCIGVMQLRAPSASNETRLTMIAVGAILIAGWFGAYVWMKRTFENQPGWRGILLDFHLTTVACCLIIPLSIGAYNLDLPPTSSILSVGTVSLASIFWGIRNYYAARKRIATMQRDAAVRIAKRVLAQTLRKERR